MKKNIVSQLTQKHSLKEAIDAMQFVQIDPIQSPTYTQDLVLRNRIEGYKNGDILRNYNQLELEEDYLYAYGYIAKDLQQLWHPRHKPKLSNFDQDILEFVKQHGHTTSKDLEQEFGKHTVQNDWGGASRATKQSLDRLHRSGLLRIANRRKGIRIYEASQGDQIKLDIAERKQELIKALVRLLQPMHKKTLNQSLFIIRRYLGETKNQVQELLARGELQELNLEGETYYALSDCNIQANTTYHEEVKFLSPFDPLVWDRLRFEQIWGWQYRFEAYTPPSRRIRGYYAMPLLWRSDIIGWVNISKQIRGRLRVRQAGYPLSNKELNFEFGYVNSKPNDKIFDIELEKEVERFREFYKV